MSHTTEDFISQFPIHMLIFIKCAILFALCTAIMKTNELLHCSLPGFLWSPNYEEVIFYLK